MSLSKDHMSSTRCTCFGLLPTKTHCFQCKGATTPDGLLLKISLHTMPCMYSQPHCACQPAQNLCNVDSSLVLHNGQVRLIELSTLTLQVLTTIALFHKAHMKPASFLFCILHQMFVHLNLKVKGSNPTHLFSTTLIFGLESLNIFLPNAIVKKNKSSLPFHE